MTHGTIGKAAHHLGLVVVGDGAAGAGGVDGFNLGDQRGYRADQGEGGVDHMRCQIAHGAICLTAGAPMDGKGGVGEEIFGMLTAKPCDIADFACCNQGAGVLAGGGADVVKADHVGGPCPVRGGNHGAAVV